MNEVITFSGYGDWLQDLKQQIKSALPSAEELQNELLTFEIENKNKNKI
jgi:hypothetical protein